MSFAEWSNKKKQEQEQNGKVSNQASNGNNSKSPTSSFSEWSSKNNASKVDSNYINTFVSDYNKFASADESSSYGSWKELDIGSRANMIRVWLDYNKNAIDENTYKSLSSVADSVSKLNDYYSQFASEDDYNDWYKKQKEQDDILGAEDFEEYYQKGKADDDNNDFIMELFGTPVGESNYIEHYRKYYADKENYGAGTISKNASFALAMTEDEVKIYNYFLGKEGKKKAQEYLDSIEDSVNQRVASGLYQTVDENKFLEMTFAVSAGLDQFMSGVRNLDNFVMGAEADPTSAIQYANSMVREDQNGAWGVAYDLLNTTGNMLPSILVGTVTGGLGGAATMGVSAVGNGYAEMRNLGYDEWQSRGYGLLVGASETVLQYALGGISKLGGKVSGNVVSKLVSKIDNAFARTAIKLGGNMASEGLEEAIQTALEPAFKALMTGEEFESAEWDDILYSALLGALSAGMLEGVPTVAGTAMNSHNANKVYGSDVQALVTESLEIDPDNTHAQRMQARLDNGKNVSGYQLNRLVEANEQAMRTQDTAKMTSATAERLAELGEQGDVNKLAEVLVKQASGEKLSLSDKNLIKNSKYGQRVSNEMSPSNIEAGNYASAWAENIGTDRINNEAYNKGLYDIAGEAAGVVADERKSFATENASAKQIATESEFKASESGVTLYNDEEVSIKKVVSTEGGIKVELDNGKTVSAKDLELSSDAEAMAFETITRMETTPETAQVILEAVKASDATSAEALYIDVPTAYKYGKINYEAGLAKLSIPDAIKKLAYNRGKQDAMTSPKGEKKAAPKQTKKSNTKKGETKQYSKVIFEGFEYSEDSATDIQKASMKAIDALSKMTNFLEIHVYESKVENGERVAIIDGKKRLAPNGYFKIGTNKVYIDINAGNKGEGTMLYTLGHEATHAIAEWNWDDFKKLGDFLIENFGKNNVNVDQLIAEKKRIIANSYKLDGKAVPSDEKLYMEAYEEVVADSMTSMFADPNAYVKLAELKKQDKTLWQKLGDVIKAILDKLKSILGVYDGMSPASKEADHVAQFSKDVYDKLQDLYLKSFVGAEANYQAAQKDGTAEKHQAKYCERDDSPNAFNPNGKTLKEQLKEALDTSESKDWRYVYVGEFTQDFIDKLKKHIDIKKLPIVMNYRDAYLSMEAKERGKYQGNGISYHNLGVDGLEAALKSFDNPVYVLLSTTKGKIELVLKGTDYKNRQLFSVVEVNTKTQNNRKFMDVHVVTSVYGNRGLKNRIATANEDGRVIYKKEEELTQGIPQVQYERDINANSSVGSISQDSEVVKSKFSEREIADISNNDYVKMYNHFGSTKNYDVAGYMLGNGIMLDFSGKHWGDDYSTSRQVDHRDVQEVLDDRGNNGVNAMIDMIGNGNIRLMPEVGGINLAVKPNAAQVSQLRGYINHFKGEIVVDIDKVGGDTIHSFSYTRGTSSSKILADIKAYFEGGVVPEQQAKDETDIRQFLYSERDSQGNELSEEQKEFFKDSKVRDENGNLLVVYHGTPNGAHNTFRTGSYFTPDAAYADKYQNPSASSLSTGKTVSNPKTYEVYLNITNPFDTRNAAERKIFQNEYYRKYGTGAPLAESGLPDWTDGMDLQEFIEEMGYDYDGLILDEGGTGGYGEEVISRGLSYVTFSSEQVKNIDNKHPTSAPDIRYQERSTYAPTFYSYMGKVVDDIRLDKMGAGGVVSYLKGKGVKNEEIKWSGIEAFLEGKKSVTKAELQEFVAGSQLQIEEKVKADNLDIRHEGDELVLTNSGQEVARFEWDEDEVAWKTVDGDAWFANEEEILDAGSDEYSSTKWKQYTLDGGSNYRELVFKLPNSTYSNRAMRGHWGQDAEGVLAHARIQDMATSDGKSMLFIEEIQSDWHNEGAEKGYQSSDIQSKIDALGAKADELFFKVEDYSTEMTGLAGEWETIEKTPNGAKLIREFREADRAYKKAMDAEIHGIEDAPFHTTYHEYVLKRLLRMAAEEGYDSIGWTPSEIQSDRWSDEYAEAYRIEYDQEMPKFLRKYGKKWGATVGKTALQGVKTKETLYDVNREEKFDRRVDWEIYVRKELAAQGMPLSDVRSVRFAEEGNYLVAYGKDGTEYDRAKVTVAGADVWSMDITDSMKDSVLNEGQVMYSERVIDKETLDFLNNQESLRVYRAMQVIDGELYPPMAARVKSENGKKELVTPSKLGEWEQAAERPDLIRNGNKFTLDKANGSSIEAAYNPYFHTSRSPLNDQFSSAYKRENLVIVEGEVPSSELTSGYRAEFAKDTVGEMSWHSGPVSSKLSKGKERKVILSRWFKPVRIVPDSEVAATIATILEGENVDVPYKVVTPSLRAELEKVGVPVKYQERDPDSISNRSLLANALDSAAKEGEERNILRNYKTNLRLLEAEQAKLADVREKARDLRFKKGRTAEETKTLNGLDFEAKQIAKRINTYDRELLKIEAMKPIKDVLNREKQMAYKRAEQKGKEALKAQRERASENYKRLLAEHQESRKKAIEGRHKTEMRHKIKKVVGDLNNLLLNPTKDKHVPIGLQLVVADALDAINMDTMNAAERVAYYNDRIAKSNNPDEIEMLTKKRDFFEYRDMSFKDKVTALKNAYAEFKNSDDPLIRNAHNDAIADLIENTSDLVGKKSLKDMSYEQLDAVYNMYKAILATVRNANKLFKEGRQETITENSESVKTEVKEAGGHRDRVLKATKFLKKFGWDMLKPVTAMKVIGSNTLASLFDNVRAGEDTWAVDVSEAKAHYEDVSTKYKYKDWDFKKRYTFKDSAGNDFSLSLEQIMSLYAYSKRDQADKHLEFGGFIFDDAIEVTEKTKIGIPMKYEVNDANPYRLRREDLLAVIESLNAEQKGFVDEMQSYLSDVMGAKGNEVSLAMYDIKLYNEKNYFPLKTSRYFREFDPEKSATPKIKNAGFSKKTVPQAGNPIVLSNFMDVWANHVNDMSMYHAFVLPLEDFTRVYNYSSTAGGYDSVQQYIKNAYGAQANQYVEKLLDDLNGGARVDSSAGVINKGLSLFKKASVFASASVVVQQPSAIARAFAYVNPKYFATATGSALNLAKHKELWAEVKKYAPVAVIKEMGYFDTGIGRSSVDWIKGNQTIMDKVDDALSKAPAIADELAWSHIWLAVKKEIKSTTNLKEGSEEFLKKAGERFTEVIVNTQVYDSVLSRSGMMRSKDTGMKMATAFMAEPTTTANMMIDGIIQGKRGNKRFLAATVGGVSASIVLNSILVALVYAARDDDEDETYAEKYIGSITSELLDGFNPLTYIPFVKDIWSIAQGYDVERSDMTVVSNLWESIERIFNENTSGWEKVADVSGAVSSLFGIPLKNIIRDAKGLYNLFETLTSGIPTTEAGIGDAVEDAFKSSIPLWDRFHETETNSDKLYEAIMSGDQVQIDRIKGRFKDEDAVEAAVRKSAKEAYVEGSLSQSEAEKMLANYGGCDANETYWDLKEWDYLKQNGTTEGYSKYGSFYEAVQTGRNLKTVISGYTSHGVEAKTLASQITSYFKPLYKKMSNSERASLKGYLLNAYAQLGYNRADKSKDIDAWLKD